MHARGDEPRTLKESHTVTSDFKKVISITLSINNVKVKVERVKQDCQVKCRLFTPLIVVVCSNFYQR